MVKLVDFSILHHLPSRIPDLFDMFCYRPEYCAADMICYAILNNRLCGCNIPLECAAIALFRMQQQM
jgi:hypothetical protein